MIIVGYLSHAQQIGVGAVPYFSSVSEQVVASFLVCQLLKLLEFD